MISRVEPIALKLEESYPDDTPAQAIVGGPFPGVAISLILTLIVASVGGVVGVRFGWIWGLVAGLIAWATAPVLLVSCLYFASGGSRD
jgi:hypothetical protein